MDYYISTVLVYLAVYALGAWALNLQFGLGGVVNFAFIIFEAVGAYVAGVMSLGHSGTALGLTYIWGASLPFPLPLLAGGLAGGLVALLVGPATMRRMRRDYQAASMLVIAIILNQVVTSAKGLFNGAEGLAGIPAPLSQYFSAATYPWVYVVWALFLMIVVYLFLQRVGRSPFGRSLRAIRDDEGAAVALGKNPWRTRMTVFVIGGVIGGLAGGLLIEFIGAWGPAAWGYQESFVLVVAVVFGGIGNQRGALIGAAVVGVVLLQLTLFLPPVGYPGLINSLQWVVIGFAWLIVLWFRPDGILPERAALGLSERSWSDRMRLGRTSGRRLIDNDEKAGSLG